MTCLVTECMTDVFDRVLEESDEVFGWDNTQAGMAETCIRLIDAVRAAGGSRDDERSAILFALGHWYEPGALELADALGPFMKEIAHAIHRYEQACVPA